MEKRIILIALGVLFVLSACKKDKIAGTSSTDLLVKQFSEAPILDGTVDNMWNDCQTLENSVEVPNLAARGTYLNSDGKGIEETLGLFAPYSGEKYDFKMRAGYTSTDIYFLLEWGDEKDSKDRMSWYFDSADSLWKQEHKYANNANDKYYEDKFAILFPIGTVSGFDASTCYATCHQGLTIVNAKDKHTRHFLNVQGQKVDMWHWKRDRSSYAGQIDDQVMVYADPNLQSAANGRKSDAGDAGFAKNSQTLNNGKKDVSVPLYIIPDKTDYYWITKDDIDNGSAKKITAVDSLGVLTLSDNSTVDPTLGDYEQATGAKRIPSITTKAFTGSRADISIKAVYTGTGWVCEFSRKLDTGHDDDVVFDVTKEYPFGLAIFNNAAIAHGIKPNLLLKFEQD